MGIFETISAEEKTHYDVLEVPPDASPQEIRSAYMRAKAAFRKDSAALYSVFSDHESEEMLRQIEEAYAILSNPQRRKDYDRVHDSINESPSLSPSPEPVAQVISIDRAPPMDMTSSGDDLLVPPSTDFTSADSPAPTPKQSEAQTAFHTPQNVVAATELSPPPANTSTARTLAEQIENETQFRGEFLRSVREAQRIAIEEISDFTKVSKNYLMAIEAEQFQKLPAAVFVRGFLQQLAKYLKLPADKMVPAYLARFNDYKNSAKK
jgi:curved DNA-binding protein CbpA